MESAATAAMESAANGVAGKATTGESASNCARSAVATTVGANITGATVAVTGTSVVAAAIAVNPAIAITVSIATTEPGAGTDKEAAAKPGRPIVSVGRAGVRIV